MDKTVTDPVCGMVIELSKAPAETTYQGHTYYFCSQQCKDAFDKNPFMKLFIGSGYFDLATPYFGTQYTLNHMGLDKSQHSRVSLGYYPAGHMMYIQDSSLGELKKDVTAFMQNALK